MPKSRSRRTVAICAAVALLGFGLALSAIPALASPIRLSNGQHGGMQTTQAAVGRLGTAPAGQRVGPTRSRTVVGAASQVSTADLHGPRTRAWPALSPPFSSTRAGSGQTSSSPAGGAYTALTPSRVLDTRVTGATLGPNSSLNLKVVGVDHVPATATAVALNVTVTDTSASGYLSVYPATGTRPLLSNLNWVSGQTVANLVIVPVGVGGQVSFYNHTGTTDVVVDLEGYFAPEVTGGTAGGYVPLAPARITDTRSGSGYPNAGRTLSAGGRLTIQVTGAGGVPSSGVMAALVNVTVTMTTAASYLTAYPAGATQPTASNLNWTAGETVANRVVVPLSSTGQITLYNHAGSTDVVVDVNGYFTNGATVPASESFYIPITPVRVLDSRQTNGPLGAGATITQQMAGVDGIGSGASAVVTNVTAADTTAASYFTVYPGGARPTASDVNWGAGQIVPNMTVATLSSRGTISIYNHAGSADVIVDAFGYFTGASATATLAVTTTSLPNATVGAAYSAALGVSGGTPPYSWTITSGALPAGLALSSSGAISGTPSAAGPVSFGVQVTDSTTPTAETAAAQLSITVASATAALAVTTTSLPSATVGVAYSATLGASGGTPPYSWAITSGALPAGLTLSSSGAISGTPSTAGSVSFGVQVTDSTTPTPETASAQLSITVASATATLAVTTTSLPSAVVGVAYSASLGASGGTLPYSWAITSGALPAGLTLSSSGAITGTPSTAGSASFGVQVTDSTTPTPETASAQLSITVASMSTLYSGNWSGYVWGNGPYTAVAGTFNVPSIYGSSTNTYTSEWIGIDGFPSQNSSLIQAGIAEQYSVSTKSYQIQAWWEILPAAETPIAMTVSPGNSVTVSIGQVSGTTWQIMLADNTTGQTFTTRQTYTGHLASAEAIVEAPFVNGAQSTLGNYAPDVTFSRLHFTGPQNAVTELIMVQNGVQVSTPSALDAVGFNVAYGARAPAAP